MDDIYIASDGSLMSESDVLEYALWLRSDSPYLNFEEWLPIDDFLDEAVYHRIKALFNDE